MIDAKPGLTGPLIRAALAEISALQSRSAAPPTSVSVGPLSVDIRFESAALQAMFAGAFAAPARGPANYRLDALSGNVSRYTPPLIPEDPDTDIQVSAGAQGYALWYGRFSHALQLVDHASGSAAYWTRDAAKVPAWERARPFLAAFHAMLAPTDWLAVHAAGIAHAGRGILLTGLGKAGKTSLALAAAQAGWRFAGDDFVLVDSATPQIAPLYATARLRADMAEYFPALRASRHEQSEELGDIRHELRLTGFEIGGAPIRAVLLLERRGATTPIFSPVSRTAVLAAISASTATSTPGYDGLRLEKILRLLRQIPPLRFDPGPDFAAALAALRELVA